MDTIMEFVYSSVGSIYIPAKLDNFSVKILHISDTPSMAFNSIIRLISKIKPDVLIHTGDMVDDIKLELYPQKELLYKSKVNNFINLLKPHIKGKFIIVPGNHDKIEVLNIDSSIELLPEGREIKLHGITLGLAHKFEYLPHGCDFYLFGHDKTHGQDETYLNGINNINIINPETYEVIRLVYPAGTNDSRLKRTKIGI